MLLGQQLGQLGGDTFAPAMTFRAAATTAAAITVTKPAGVAVGDLVVVLCGDTDVTNSMNTSSGAVWSSSFITWHRNGGAAITSGLFWKVLNATDVANTWNNGQSNNYHAVAYSGSGALSAAIRSSNFSTGLAGSVTILGFMPSGGSKGVVAAGVKGTTLGSLTGPTGFVERITGGNANCEGEIDDVSTAYFGADVAFTTGGGSTDLAGWLLEVL